MIFDMPPPPTVDAIILKRAGDTCLSSQSMDPQLSGLLYLYFLGEFAAEDCPIFTAHDCIVRNALG